MISIALLGTAHIHTPDFVRRLPHRKDVKVVTVWDHDSARAQKYADQLGVKTTNDLGSVWKDSSISAAIVCSETIHHLDLVLPAAAAGKNLFVEKPLGASRKDAYAMAREIKKAGVIFQTGYFRRGNRANLTLKALVERGVFGQITRVRDTNMHHGSLGGWFDTDFRWMANPAESGVGAFGDMGAHSLDLLIWLFGDIERVTGLINPVTHRYGNCDETGEALLKFKNGANATIGAGWLDHGDPFPVLVSGTKAIAYIQGDQLYLNCKDVTGQDGFQPYSEYSENLPHAFDQFLDAIVGLNKPPLVSVEDAAYGAAVMESIYRGSEDKKWVEIAQPDL